MTKRHRSLTLCAALAGVAMMAISACQPEAVARCGGGYGAGNYALIQHGVGADERLIATMTAFANARHLEHEANRYPRGVPGNPRRQFLMTVCDEHFYALASYMENGWISIEMLGDTYDPPGGIDPMALNLARHLRREFSDIELDSSLSFMIDDGGRRATAAEVAADAARADERDRQLLNGQ